jgi:hypothetical protein
MPKQTRLDEQAVIYQPRKEQTEKEKLKDMKFSDKLSYLWEYYKFHAAVTIAVIAFAGYMVYQFVTPDVKSQFYAAIINSAVNPDTMAQYKTDFADYLQLDPERQSVDLNDTFYLSSDNEYMSALQQALTTYIAAGQVDVIIAPESVFNSYAYNGYMAKLSDELPTNVYSSLTDYFYMTDIDGDPNKNAYGIYLSDTNLFKGITYNNEPYILGIIPNYPHVDNTIEFIKYLFSK